MSLVYEQNYQIGYSQSDLYGNIKASCLLGFMQDIGGTHSEILGISRKILMEKYNAFWMLVRVQFNLQRPLKVDEIVNIKTYARNIKGAIMYRDFEFSVDHEFVGDAQSAWVVANGDTRKIMRPANVGLDKVFVNNDMGELRELGHIKIEGDSEYCFERSVVYSDLDINKHLNNTRYADIALDAIKVQRFDDSFVSFMQINYLEECVDDESVRVYCVKADNEYCVFGEKNGKHCFEARVCLEKL